MKENGNHFRRNKKLCFEIFRGAMNGGVSIVILFKY